MTVLTPGEGSWQYRYVDLGKPQDACFLCGSIIPRHEVAVMWAGFGADIVFHARCATSFVLRLARDCWEVEHSA